ncbi:MAG TPA: redoxin domain-containing protein [Dehalococcoidia bacterium]|nr:redoxin domain-containing protein [Dehalococcoidia bacterium]
MPEVGERIETFELAGLDGPVRVPDPQGRRTLLMFFQEAGTPTCSTQVQSVASEAPLLDELGAIAVCVSTDPPEALQRFRANLNGQVVLAQDEGGELARRFGVYDDVSRRAQRAAFVIDPDGTLLKAIPWYNPMHADQLASLFEALGLTDD